MLLKFDNFEIKIDLDNSETAFKLAKLSSFKAQINTWGEEIYFETKNLGIKPNKNARDIVTFGEVAYWCEGHSIAIGFGKTPVSIGNEIRLVSKVNVFASFSTSSKVLNNLKTLNNNHKVTIII
ncbi:MAG: hypothetical protein EBR80_03165 [Proteobacteria bacterium]|jgi:hypothetical protein|nr:hypothetical protein [Candidatus Fonsibacter lacus]